MNNGDLSPPTKTHRKTAKCLCIFSNVMYNNDLYIWKTPGYPVNYADMSQTTKTGSHRSCPQSYFTDRDNKWLLRNNCQQKKQKTKNKEINSYHQNFYGNLYSQYTFVCASGTHTLFTQTQEEMKIFYVSHHFNT